MTLTIRPFTSTDYDVWLPLWSDNNDHQQSKDVNTQTWQRLCDPNSEVHGLGAFSGNKLAGFLHYIIHPTTGHMQPACYMQDLWVAENWRRQGVAKQLLSALYKEHQRIGWSRIYWLVEDSNIAARRLYESFGVRLDFSLHVAI